MSLTLNQALQAVRLDLGDTDPATYRWSNDELTRHVTHALDEISRLLPRQRSVTLTTTADSRNLDLSAYPDRSAIRAVEYPTANYPPTYVRWQEWGDTLTMLIDGAPGASENVKVYYESHHTIDDGGSTLPPWADELLPVGAAANAALQWASIAANRANVGGPRVSDAYARMATQQLGRFHRQLRERTSSIKTSSLYTPADPKPSQSTDFGP